MIIKFTDAFKDIIETDQMDVLISEPISISELVDYIAKNNVGFEIYSTIKSEAIFNAQINFVRNGLILQPKDIVYDDDEIKVFLPVTGG